METSPQPSDPPKRRGLKRRITDLHVDITSILHGYTPTPHFLASDITGYLLFTLLATDWPSLWRAKLFRAFPCAQAASETFSGFWNAFWQERWHQEDDAESKTTKWNPGLYKSPSPRMRSCREVLNRQQALRNCCAAQMEGFEGRDVVKEMVLQVALAFCWLWAVLKEYRRLLCLVHSIETDGEECRREEVGREVPVVVCKGEGTMPVARGGPSYCCLRRLQRHIDRGQSMIDKFVELEMCDGTDDTLWTEMEWLSEKEGEIPAEMPQQDRFLVDRVVFSAGLSWLMVAISCDFATFYFLVLIRRLRARLLP
ncbi:hypothetical protein CABS03_01250 [Colletotrichum abscissum]|uniref:Uncharacterized protein n=2 Tax=Colletotrichum abscissum TaxID=1671311 RepID=A0A9P9XAX5_9PEZI|nr:hypothetical protein CABS02_09152 [Colletotrichum abscissum]